MAMPGCSKIESELRTHPHKTHVISFISFALYPDVSDCGGCVFLPTGNRFARCRGVSVGF